KSLSNFHPNSESVVSTDHFHQEVQLCPQLAKKNLDTDFHYPKYLMHSDQKAWTSNNQSHLDLYQLPNKHCHLYPRHQEGSSQLMVHSDRWIQYWKLLKMSSLAFKFLEKNHLNKEYY